MKNLTAKQKFEKLGYTDNWQKNAASDGQVKWDMISYSKYISKNSLKTVFFNLNKEEFICNCLNIDNCETSPGIIDMDLLEAIETQIAELGW